MFAKFRFLVGQIQCSITPMSFMLTIKLRLRKKFSPGMMTSSMPRCCLFDCDMDGVVTASHELQVHSLIKTATQLAQVPHNATILNDCIHSELCYHRRLQVASVRSFFSQLSMEELILYPSMQTILSIVYRFSFRIQSTC